jgi:diguanylate cyclase (GGDEF)-like protein
LQIMKRTVKLSSVFQPSDSIAFVVIAFGLFLALFIDEMAVRLIGICISVLGGVALFMMISPRLTDLPSLRTPKPSVSHSLDSQTQQDGQTTAQIFDKDKFLEIFGPQQSSLDSPVTMFADEAQVELFPTPSPTSKKPQPPAVRPQQSAAQMFPPSFSMDDGTSGVRVIGTKPASAAVFAKQPVVKPLPRTVELAEAPALMVDPLQDEQTEHTLPPLEGHKDGTRLSDEVVIRVAPKAAEKLKEQPPQASAAAQEIEPEHVDQPIEQHIASPPAPRVRETTVVRPNVHRTVFGEDELEEGGSADEPRKEFDYLLERVLMVIRSATNARTAAFFWVNHDTQQLVCESKITEAESFTKQRKLPLGKDAVSRIALEGSPEILTNISPAAELDVLPYYTAGAKTASFVGVPVYYGGAVVGVLCADSLMDDAYSEITIGFFGQFTKLISGLVKSYTGKFELLHAAETLKALSSLQALAAEAPLTREHVIDCAMSVAVRHINQHTIGAVVYHPTQKQWLVMAVDSSQQGGFEAILNKSVMLRNSVVGSCIMSSTTVMQPFDPSSIQICPGEPAARGHFMAVPLRSTSATYGALFHQNETAAFSANDISLAEALAVRVGQYIELLHVSEEAEAGNILDTTTGALNRSGYEERVSQEFARAVDISQPLTVCVLKLDASRAVGEALLPRFLPSVSSILFSQVREYDVVGRIGVVTLAVALVNTRVQEAHVWTENVRKEIASRAVDIDGKRLSITVSIGVAQANVRESAERVLEQAEQMAMESQTTGNKVLVYA